jgi:3D (Asp-Asp-Asp) domain-containing protein
MRLLRYTVPLVLVVSMMLWIGAAASAHLPKAVRIQTESGVRVVSTYRATIGDVLSEAGIALGPHDRVIPAATALSSGLLIEVRRAFSVTLYVDGGRRTWMTAASTVEEFITTSGVPLRSQDRVYPSLEQTLPSGAVVRIVRVDTQIIAKPERVPFVRVSRPDASLPRGMTRVIQPGRAGTRIRRIAVTLADGVVIDRQVLGAQVVQPPQDHIMQVGTRRLFASRGEFAGKEIIHMEATGYAPWTGKGVDDITSIGMKAGYGVVAVDPTVVPLRSELFIEGYGRAIAGDVGGAIKGHRIDLGFNTARQAIQFGRRPVRVYLLSTPPPRQKR